MTDDFSSPKFLELLTLLLIVFHGPNVAATRAEAAPSSPLPGQMDARIRVAGANDDGVVTLVEAPVEVVGPRAVESTMLEKVETKRESGFENSARDKGSFGVINGRERSIRVEDDTNDDWEEDGDEADDSLENDDGDDDEEELEEEEEEEEEEEDADDDEDVNDEDDLILKRKAGRHYREGPRIWDQWGKWSSCSVSCGAGKLNRWRHCVAGGCSLGNGRKLQNPKVWDQWGRWSCCSATCGIGKYTRWRHCVAGGCVSGEKEAQIKSCKKNRCS